MRINRSIIINKGRDQVFHVVSRVVDKNLIFEDEQKNEFLKYMRRLEAFSGVGVLAYCLMGNHFHLLLHVPPKPEEIPDDEVRRRMKILYGERMMHIIDGEIQENIEMGDVKFESELYDNVRRRLFNLSSFVGDLKLRFSKWYNNEHGRKGTLWEERFRSVLVEPSESAMMRVAAYIELNPVRAGLVQQPHEYKWCSYTEAVAGSNKAKSGISKIVGGIGSHMSWDKASNIYRSYFLHTAVSQNYKKRGISEEEYRKSQENEGELPIQEKLRTRLRYMTDGVALGSASFVKEFVLHNKEAFPPDRKSLGNPLDDPPRDLGLYSCRKVE